MTEFRQQILDHAGDLFLESGMEGFSMRKLAQRVGVTAPALYRHYESRDALLVEVVGASAEAMMAYLVRALSGTSPMDRLRRAGEAYLDFALDHPRYFLLYASLCERLGAEAMEAGVGDVVGGISQFWEDRVRECLQTGAFRPGVPDGIGLTLWVHAYGFVSLYLGGALAGMVDEGNVRTTYMESCIRILRGLAAPGVLEDAGMAGGEAPPPAPGVGARAARGTMASDPAVNPGGETPSPGAAS
jgi:AcrR family transcriptional regulator